MTADAHGPRWQEIAAAVPAEYRPGCAGLPPENCPREEWWQWRHPDGADLHLDRYGPADAPATLVVLHGGGGNGRLVGPLGVMAARAGFAAVAPDLPGYGATRVPDRRAIRYRDWVECASELLTAHADRPLVVVGLSMGGLLAYDAVAHAGVGAAVIATCLLDTTDPAVRRGIARPGWLGAVARPMLRALRPADRLRVPVRALTDMMGIANDRRLAALIAGDPASGGTWMPLGFFRDYLHHRPLVAPEQFTGRLVLAHPAADPWTPIELSLRFAHRIPPGHREVVLLERAGHLPVERPGIDQLADVVVRELRAAADRAA